ncbi:MAG: glycosyltransferase family 4 protein [Anaerolineaceae bacterium]|nr:glycosyltransferase family 4 protein [Anaerolineaceae bacterium]
MISPFTYPCEEQQAVPELKKYCYEVKAVQIPATTKLHQRLAKRIRREYQFWGNRIPLDVTDYSCDGLRRAIVEATQAQHFDATEITYWSMGQYCKNIDQRIPIVLLQHDSIFLNVLRQKARGYSRKLTWRIREWFFLHTSMRDYEKKICNLFDWILFLSSADMDCVNQRYGIENRTSVLPIPYCIEPGTGLNCGHHQPDVLFLGGMHTPYNIDSIRYFKNSILPILLRDIPDVQLTVVGQPPTRSIRKELENPHIHFIGFQDDLTKLFHQHAVLIAPVLTGSGIKTKILEGLARGIPIVTTPIGIEGMRLINNREILLAQSAEEFAYQIARLLNDPILWAIISKNAIARFVQTYQYDVAYEKTLQTYESVILDQIPRNRNPRFEMINRNSSS